MNEIMDLTRADLIKRFRLKDIELTDFSLSLDKIHMANYISFKCSITEKSKCLKSRYSYMRKIGEIY